MQITFEVKEAQALEAIRTALKEHNPFISPKHIPKVATKLLSRVCEREANFLINGNLEGMARLLFGEYFNDIENDKDKQVIRQLINGKHK